MFSEADVTLLISNHVGFMMVVKLVFCIYKHFCSSTCFFVNLFMFYVRERRGYFVLGICSADQSGSGYFVLGICSADQSGRGYFILGICSADQLGRDYLS